MPWSKAALVVGGIVRKGDDVLLVRERHPDGLAERWGIPGGIVEPGELLPDAVIREVEEETGLRVRELGPVAFVSQHFHPDHEESLLHVAFEVSQCTGDIQPRDPDQLILEARFVPTSLAAELVLADAFQPSSAPLAAYLAGDRQGTPGWFWRLGDNTAVPVYVAPGRIPGSARP